MLVSLSKQQGVPQPLEIQVLSDTTKSVKGDSPLLFIRGMNFHGAAGDA